MCSCRLRCSELCCFSRGSLGGITRWAEPESLNYLEKLCVTKSNSAKERYNLVLWYIITEIFGGMPCVSVCGVCMCSCEWVYIRIWVHICTCKWRPEIDTGWLLCLIAGFVFCLFWQCLSMNLELVTLARLSGQWASTIRLSPRFPNAPSALQGLQICTSSPSVYIGEGINSSPHDCSTDTLQTGPSP